MSWLRTNMFWRDVTWRHRDYHAIGLLSCMTMVVTIVLSSMTDVSAAEDNSHNATVQNAAEASRSTSSEANLPLRFRRSTMSPKKYVPKSPRLTAELLSRFPNQRPATRQEDANGRAGDGGLRQSDRLMHETPPQSRGNLHDPPLPDKSPTLRQAGRIAPRISGESETVRRESKTVRQVTHEAANRFQEYHGPARVIDFQLLDDPFEDEGDEGLDEYVEEDDAESELGIAMFEQEDLMTVADGSPFEVIDPEPEPITVTVRRSVLMRTDYDIYRTAVVDPEICDLVQFTPREVSIIGREVGSTMVTFWFKNGGQPPLTYVVNVEPDLQARRVLEDEYEVLARILTELFPDSKVELLPVADKLIVRGQAKDAQEAAQILQIIRSEAGLSQQGGGGQGAGRNFGSDDPTLGGLAAAVLSQDELGGRSRSGLMLVNLLRVPGPQQIALKVKIAELNRSAARGAGIDVDAEINISDTAGLFINSMLNGATAGTAGGGGPSVISQFDGDDIQIGVRWLEQEGVLRMLSEPTLVTLSGRPATFVAGGEFAVPTAVGVGGIGAVTTDFRTFGAIISFLPTVIDKDYIRLEVSPEFSQINSNLSTNSGMGLDVRSVTTTVEMREGQTLAIAGLIDVSMNGTKRGDLPVFSHIFGRRDISRNETELIILVTPELIHPMDPEEVPPLPGFDVTEPTGREFYLHGHLEGNPTQDHRSTIWPRLRRRYQGNGPAMPSGPFGHGQ